MDTNDEDGAATEEYDQQDFEEFEFPQSPQQQTHESQRFLPRIAFASKQTPPQQQARAALTPMVAVAGKPLRPTSDAGKFASLFPFDTFNAVQSLVFETVFRTDKNVLVTAPTASGKSTVLELAICRLASHVGHTKAVYLGPTRALCHEIASSWKQRFGTVGIRCIELTGDSDPADAQADLVASHDVVIATPEKWDSVMRRWQDRAGFVADLGLVLIDEVHLLGSNRGAVLEAVVSRMKIVHTTASSAVPKLRIIAVSATVPNVSDVAAWIEAPPEATFALDDRYRPVPLEIRVLGYNRAKNEYLFDHFLDFKLPNIIAEFGRGKPTLIFCSSRKGAASAAQMLAKNCNVRMLIRSPDHAALLGKAAEKINDRTLADCLRKGVGFHTAGLSHSDRGAVEELFLSEQLLVLCTTSTLSLGVNLPAHTVVVKGTQQYRAGVGYVELDELDVRQMAGRAGRPQFDTSAVAVIMTSFDHQRRWQSALLCETPLESALLSRIKEHLVAEIVLGSIVDVRTATEWLKSTFLWQRIKTNPKHYSIPCGLSHGALMENLQAIVSHNLQELACLGLIHVDGQKVKATDLGTVQTRHYVAVATAALFSAVDPNAATLGDLVSLVSQAKEFEDLHLRKSEKRPLNEANRNGSVRFPLKGKVRSVANKVNVLLQTVLAGRDLSDEWGLRQDTQTIFRCIGRICSCLSKCITLSDAARFSYEPLLNSLLLCKVVTQRMWETDPLPLRQLDGIGVAHATSLSENGISTFEQLRAAPPHQIEGACGRRPPFGTSIKESLQAKVPHLELEATRSEGGTGPQLDVVATVTCMERSSSATHLLIGDSRNKLLLHRVFSCQAGSPRAQLRASVSVGLSSWIVLVLCSDSFVGVDVVKRVAPVIDVSADLGDEILAPIFEPPAAAVEAPSVPPPAAKKRPSVKQTDATTPKRHRRQQQSKQQPKRARISLPAVPLLSPKLQQQPPSPKQQQQQQQEAEMFEGLFDGLFEFY